MLIEMLSVPVVFLTFVLVVMYIDHRNSKKQKQIH